MPTSTVEQYIKIIYTQREHLGEGVVPMKRLSEAMGVTPGTATTMVKHLDEVELVRYQPRQGVLLTEKGENLALRMLRRHRLIETFLEQVLGYDWSEVHADAERLEHAVSDRFIDKLEDYLGYPEVDPHGDPIPTASGAIEPAIGIPLNTCAPGRRVQIARLIDDDTDFLVYMKNSMIVPGQDFGVRENSAVAGTVTIEHLATRRVVTVGFEPAGRILVSEHG